MGRIALHFDQHRREMPLLASTTIGRHWSNTAQVMDSRVPYRWLEIRWMGRNWAWRPLAEKETRGSGKLLDQGWREFTRGREPDGPRAGDRVTLGNAGWIELLDPSPPVLLLQDLETGTFIEGPSIESYVELRSEGVLPIDWETEWRRPLKDGEVAMIRGRALRVHLPDSAVPTLNSELDLTHPECSLDIALGPLSATFTIGAISVSVVGEPVRTLAAYAQGRLDGAADDGGWLSRDEVFAIWRGLGGNENSEPNRLGWERGRLRTALVRAGASNVSQLFESTRRGGHSRIRLRLLPTSLTLQLTEDGE